MYREEITVERRERARFSPEGTDLTRHKPDDLGAVAIALNSRPRKTLGWKTPAEALDELLRSSHQVRVATTR
jgi:IS30 family transposase